MNHKDDSQQFKADGGKTRPTLISIGFARALRVVQATTDYGAEKYEAHSWRGVPNGIERYLEAAARHRQEREIQQSQQKNVYDPGAILSHDEESGLAHLAHEIFCLLAVLELAVSTPDGEMIDLLSYNEPPKGHKQ